ncbi:AMP-binding enzyme family protein [Mycobacterium xenopi 3993]|nr:AMP-binding enzyme family protein [Mycobacterium xenopi 3993]
MCELFDRTTRRHADLPALHSTDGVVNLTYRQYRDAVIDIAGALYLQGIRRGDLVALMFENRPEFHLIDTAAMHLGATTCSIYNTSPIPDIEYVLANSGAKLAVCEEKFAPNLVKAASADCEIICTTADVTGTVCLDTLARPTPEEFDFEATWRAVGPDDVLTLIYTSGTTGTPKGVELTHGAMLAEVALTSEVLDFRPGDRVPSALPMAHAAQRWGTLYSAIAFGLDVTCVDDVTKLLPTLVRLRPQIWGTVPASWRRSPRDYRQSSRPSQTRRGRPPSTLHSTSAPGWSHFAKSTATFRCQRTLPPTIPRRIGWCWPRFANHLDWIN